MIFYFNKDFLNVLSIQGKSQGLCIANYRRDYEASTPDFHEFRGFPRK